MYMPLVPYCVLIHLLSQCLIAVADGYLFTQWMTTARRHQLKIVNEISNMQHESKSPLNNKANPILIII